MPYQQLFRQSFDFGFGPSQQTQYLTPEEEDSLLAQLGGYARGGLGFVADVLDTPGAIIRGLLAGENPLPGIFDVSKRTSLEDLTGSNDFLTNLGVGVLTDPLTYLTFGGSALSKAGQVARSAGLIDDAARIAGTGSRVGRLRSSLDDLIAGAADPIAAREAAETAAQHGFGTTLADLGGQKVGGLIGVGLPFQEPMAAFGTGDIAQKFAGLLDTLGEKITYSRPGKYLSSLFDPEVRGETNEAVQRALRGRATEFAQNRYDVTGDTLAALNQLRRVEGGLSDDMGSNIVRALEGWGYPVLPGDPQGQSIVNDLITQARTQLDEIPKTHQDLGIRSSYLVDPAADQLLRDPSQYYPQASPYFPHVLSDTSAAGKLGKRVLNTFDPFEEHHRKFTGIAGGRETINEISRDPEVLYGIGRGFEPGDVVFAGDRQNYGKILAVAGDEAVVNFVSPQGAAAQVQLPLSQLRLLKQANPNRVPLTLEQSAEVIKQKYGPLFVHDADSMINSLAGSIRTLQPDQRVAGMFGNHPLVDIGARRLVSKDVETAAHAVYDVLAKELKPPHLAQLGEANPTLADVLKAADLNPGDATQGAIKQLADRMGSVPQDILSWHVAPEVGEALGRIMKGFTQPEEISEIGKFVDSFTNLFKAGVLTTPAYLVRNRISGAVQNWIIGEWSWSLDRATEKLIGGGAIDDALQYPLVQKIIADRGLPQTPEVGTDILRELIGMYGVAGKNLSQQGAVTGAAANARGTIEDLMAALPGARPAPTYTEVATSWIPRSREELNPLNIRGVGGRTETTFAPVRATADASYTIEAMNRITPFLSQLRRGVDPATAAAKVIAAHANYAPQAFTQFENAYLRRIFPFYSFTRQMVPFVLKQLTERPGGRMAQTIRATDLLSGSEDWLPEWIASTAAVPIGEEKDGTQRFLTGLGLMHEDVLGLVRHGVDSYHTLQNIGQELLGRSNPLIKGPVEFTAGKQFFTGRELEDLDSSLGRIVQNVTGSEYPPEVPIVADQIVSNSPLSRLVSSARTATDPRKEWWAKALNLLTGARVTDVDMNLQRSVQAREILEDVLRSDPAVRSFEHIYIRPEDVGRLGPDELEAMMLYKQLSLQAQRDARARRASQQPTLYDLLAP